jgi:hypothetical protein
LLNLLDERCGGVFDDIDDVISAEERERFMSTYKAAAGLGMDRLNAAPPTIPAGASVGRRKADSFFQSVASAKSIP